ncbi:MAG TPA: hypothetical protein DEQ38_14415 [Elusimicrobia bacterium]|nr:MAG: hypothetical protein A2089_06870 [Elusimicrobia bacterium GWD2_63_28]HCC49288.1 hypothetical protein [Elusimicrobiota bacterium]
MAFPSQPPLSGGPEKRKESIFASLSPAAAPAPAPQQAPAPRGAASEDITALKQKLDGLEKNIVAGIEKRLSEQFASIARASAPAPLPPAPPRPPADPALTSKLEALEKKLFDFAQQSSLAGGMLKNIEESKISARREIEDLLKAVREQQKYSEVDRQMHDQLEKSWKRVEETERKLMDFYSALMAAETRRRAEGEVNSRRAGEDARALAQGLQALEQRLAGMEERFVKIAEDASPDRHAKIVKDFSESLSDGRRALEASASETAGRFAAQAEEERRASRAAAEALAGELRQAAQDSLRRMEELYGGERRQLEEKNRGFAEDFGRRLTGAIEEQGRLAEERLASFRKTFQEGVAKELELIRRGFDDSLQAARRDGDARAAALDGKVAEFARLAGDNKIKADGVVEAVEAMAERVARDSAALTAGAASEMKACYSELAAAMRAENAERFEKLGARYADAMLSMSFMDSFFLSVEESERKIAAVSSELGAALKDLDKDRVQSLTGVSGDVLRRKLASVETLQAGLAAEAERLAGIRAALAAKLKGVFPERQP